MVPGVVYKYRTAATLSQFKNSSNKNSSNKKNSNKKNSNKKNSNKKNSNKNSSNMDPTKTIKDEASILTMDDQKSSKDGPRQRLSVRSSKFDRGNKGFLDDEEQLLVKYDANGDGRIDAAELFSIVEDLNKEKQKKKGLKKGLGLSLVAILLLLTMSFGLVWAVVALTKEVVVDGSGHLVDSHTGNVVETRPEASLIHLKADSGVARRFLMRKLQDSVGGGLDRSDELDGEGRQHLGTASKSGVHTAYRRFQENSEHCNAVVTVNGVEYTRPLNLAGISRKEEDADRRKLGGDGGSPPRKLLYQGIYMESDPDQEFRLDCEDEEDDCTVFSVGRFHPGSPSNRRLAYIGKDQCQDNDGCNGDFTCDTTWGDNRCTCNEDTDCEYLIESGGAHYAYRHYSPIDSQCTSGKCYTYYSCFSASMTTMTPDGPKRMDELKINDLVLTSSGQFQKVYAWLHRTPEKVAASQARESEYLQIVTDRGNKIEITPKHMIYINDQQYPVEAGHVKVGDFLSLMEPSHATTTTKAAKVTAITTVKLMGGFSPATEDGTIVVNGLLASSYSNPRYTDNEHVVVAGKPLMHRQAFTHLITSPLRLLCIHVNSAFCEVDMDGEAFLPFSKGVDKLYVASANAGIVDSVLMLTGFVGMMAHGIELFFKMFGLPLMASGCVLALINAVAPFNFNMQIVNKAKKVN
ncbi:Desert hedgehog protein [Seminavis robusta]|uniref:Desert hedgehog protein n=1 Tax=Seminavis robusta TaxID=568900 RepID=A0A9N8HGF9_9STRA|nr:Desert hedgehog protein [Seminavis robusta]|eukprot:Sro507_g156600.1 Desert hedgehog protein (690) ;mRNA; r:53691-56014